MLSRLKFVLKPVERFLGRIPVSPSTLTILGFISSLIAMFFLSAGLFVEGGVFVLISGLFDILDGMVARARGKVSRRGAILDSVLDRLSEIAIFSGIFLFFSREPSDLGRIATLLAITGALMVSYIRARCEVEGIEMRRGFMQRPERFFVLIVSIFLTPFFGMALKIGMIIIASLSYITALERLLIGLIKAKG